MPVIVVTSDKGEETEKRVLQQGAMDFVIRPCEPEVLLRRVGNLIEYRTAREALTDMEYDSMTGCYTKQAFFHYASLLLRQQSMPYSLFVTDIDGFKAINERFGPSAGDQILRQIGASLQPTVGPLQLLGRYDSDRFLCLTPTALLDDVHGPLATYQRLVSQEIIPGVRVVGKVGLYRDVDITLTVAGMCDRAVLAL